MNRLYCAYHDAPSYVEPEIHVPLRPQQRVHWMPCSFTGGFHLRIIDDGLPEDDGA